MIADFQIKKMIIFSGDKKISKYHFAINILACNIKCCMHVGWHEYLCERSYYEFCHMRNIIFKECFCFKFNTLGLTPVFTWISVWKWSVGKRLNQEFVNFYVLNRDCRCQRSCKEPLEWSFASILSLLAQVQNKIKKRFFFHADFVREKKLYMMAV